MDEWNLGATAWLVLGGRPIHQGLRSWAKNFPTTPFPPAEGSLWRDWTLDCGMLFSLTRAKICDMDAELTGALDDLILGRGVARGRHSLLYRGRSVRRELEKRLAANAFYLMTVREAPIEPGEKIPAFCLHDDTADFGYIRWEIFTPRSRRKLFASDYRRPDNQEWAIQLNLASPEKVWASPERKERHDVETVVAVNP